MDPCVVVLHPVAEIQPERVDPGEEQGAQPLGRRAGGSHGGDDLGVTVTAHGVSAS